MYSFTVDGLTRWRWTDRNWSSALHHMVPGNYRGLATQEVLLYDSLKGEAQFYQVYDRYRPS